MAGSWGRTGVIVIDPLISAECAAASLALYRTNRGNRPVTGVIYTHSHVDHFGGVMGVLPEGAGNVPIVAPHGFLENAVSENLYAGVAMSRRATDQYGANLDPSPAGQVSLGLGIAISTGSVGLLARPLRSPGPGRKRRSTRCGSSSRSPPAPRRQPR